MGHEVRASARISSNKAIRSSVGAVLTNKQAASSKDFMSQQLALEDGHVEEGEEEPKGKRRRTAGTASKREPTENEKKQKEFDAGMRKNLD